MLHFRYVPGVPNRPKDLGVGLVKAIRRPAGIWRACDVPSHCHWGRQINITLPQRILRAVDAHANRSGEARRGFPASAAGDAMRKPTAGRPYVLRSATRPMGGKSSRSGSADCCDIAIW